MRNRTNRFDRFVSMQSGSANSNWLGDGLTLSSPFFGELTLFPIKQVQCKPAS